MQGIIDAVEKEKDSRFKKPWVKLDKGSKLNRLTIFIENEIESKNLNSDCQKKLRKILINAHEKGSLNKINDVEYDQELQEIVSIKNLIYNEVKQSYSFNLPKKIIKPTTKSKSKIDRHFSRSKENKK